ncbi:hypothetical protein ElyMa_003786500 [Elysia marginata]|uniref:Uncharacterized protein n=1 Tax=Elysia marginata TaxID=1093978 RepID=A0AAV4FAN7_9GAST|nr:hypothetical protein ElyMa_003786500 [Elysia marginata]
MKDDEVYGLLDLSDSDVSDWIPDDEELDLERPDDEEEPQPGTSAEVKSIYHQERLESTPTPTPGAELTKTEPAKKRLKQQRAKAEQSLNNTQRTSNSTVKSKPAKHKRQAAIGK